MIALELTAEQRSAVDAPYDGCIAILGAPGTGKTTALAQRAARARALVPHAEPLLVAHPHRLDEYAVALLASSGIVATLVDDVEAELLLRAECASLFALDWEDFAQNQLDPEVPGLRTPRRFLQSAFRLIRRLRDANIEPALFLRRALTGATEFYAKPPNFVDPSLLSATKNSYHDSLDVTTQELSRQRLREIDLAKILAKLYEGYVELVNATGRMTGRDAVTAATRLLREDPALASRLRHLHRFAFVDEAQELSIAELELLGAIFGERLPGVTLCGDPSSAISTLRAGRPGAAFALADARIELHQQHRSPAVEVHRSLHVRDEAEFIAQRVSWLLAQGVAPERIAVLFRSVRNVVPYESALLDRDVPTVISGDLNIFDERRALDALALLWNVCDPFRHDWLLRTLGNPAFGLSDASLAILCGEPPDPQRPLFAFDDEPAPTTRASRWHPQRDLRLGWNVIRGEQDDALSPDAAARVQRFRRLREGWLETMHAASFETFARAVWREGLAREGAPGSVRARAQQVVLHRLLDRLNAFRAQSADATIADVLEYAVERMESDLDAWTPPLRGSAQDGTNDNRGFVEILSVEAARGREFDHVIVADVRPGAFPLWYVPDAFLFSERLGMIPKENAGDARSSRTAKFSFYMFRAKAARGYNERERRAFVYARSRARKSVLVTASGTPTRGVTAPELLEELR